MHERQPAVEPHHEPAAEREPRAEKGLGHLPPPAWLRSSATGLGCSSRGPLLSQAVHKLTNACHVGIVQSGADDPHRQVAASRHQPIVRGPLPTAPEPRSRDHLWPFRKRCQDLRRAIQLQRVPDRGRQAVPHAVFILAPWPRRDNTGDVRACQRARPGRAHVLECLNSHGVDLRVKAEVGLIQ